MKRSVVQIIHEQPEWLPHVGWWRVLQVVRLLAMVPMLILGFFSMFEKGDMFGTVLAVFLALGSFIASHGIGWTIAWITTGFKETKKS